MGSTNVSTPAAPPAPTTADATKAYIEGLPAMYQAQMDWAPKLAQQDISLLQQYLPQVTALTQQLQSQYAPQEAAQQWALQEQYAPLLAAQQQQLQQQYEPGSYNALQNLGSQMTPEYLSGQGAYNPAQSDMFNQMSSMMTPDWMTGYSAQNAPGMDAARDRIVQQARSAWADRGLATSGMSAEDEARMVSEFEFPYALQQEALTQQTLAQRQGMGLTAAQTQLANDQNAWQNYYAELGRRQNVGLSLAGRYNTPTQQTVSTPQVGIANYQTPNVMSGYSFPQVQNSMMSGYGNYSSTYGNMYNTNAQMQQSQNSLYGNMIGGALGAFGSFLGRPA